MRPSSVSPMKTPSTVLAAYGAAARIAPAMSSARVTSGGMKMAITASTSSSAATSSIVRRNSSGPAEAIMSTGLPTAACAARRCRSRRRAGSPSGSTRAPAGGGAAALDRHDGLAGGHLAGDRAEAARVAEGLEVEQDDVGGVVALPVAQEVVARQVGLVAERHERREPNAAARGLGDRRD